MGKFFESEGEVYATIAIVVFILILIVVVGIEEGWWA
jgi:hypothetical protein